MAPTTRGNGRSSVVNEGESSGTPAVEKFLEALTNSMAEQREQTAMMMRFMMEHFGGQDNAQQANPAREANHTEGTLVPPVQQPARGARTITEFQKLRPSTLDGSEDFKGLHDWIDEMEKDFRAMHCSEEDKMTFGPHQLVGDAHHWWMLEEQALAGAVITWEDFKQKLVQKYLPRAERDRLHREFLELRQAGRSVKEYEREFARLSRYAGATITNEEEKIAKFEHGLRFGLRDFVQAYNAQTYVESVNAAIKVELNEAQRLALRDNQKKRPQPTQGDRGKKPQVAVAAATPPPPPGQPAGCTRCGHWNHVAKDCKCTLKCHKCGKVGHIKKLCRSKAAVIQAQPLAAVAPPLALPAPGGQMVTHQGRLYSLTPQDAGTLPGVISGTF